MKAKRMKISFFIYWLFFNVFVIYSEGTPDKDKQAYEQIQLKIVNLSDAKINFYFNRLYFPKEIDVNEEYITMNTPITESNEYPGFIGIQYNNEDIIVYRFASRGHVRIGVNRQYIVVVKNDSINFIEKKHDENIDYFDETLYQRYGYWYKEKLGEKFIEIKINNNSKTPKSLHIYTIVEEVHRLSIGVNAASKSYIIDDRLFALGDIEILILDNERFFDQIFLRNYRRDNINIKINDNGYEISYGGRKFLTQKKI
jgi:hypothetical protein